MPLPIVSKTHAKGIELFLLTTLSLLGAVGVTPRAIAQHSRPFSICVAERASRRHISTGAAIGECKNLYARTSANERYSTCVANLTSLRHISARDALGICEGVFFGKVVPGNYTTCVSRLGSLRHISTNRAKVSCGGVFQNAARPSHGVTHGGIRHSVTIGAPGAFSVPHSGRVRPKTRRTARKCFNVALNQIWADIHCQAHVGRSYNSPFEWRTIYLD